MLEKTKHYLEHFYPETTYYDGYQAVVDELSAAIAETSITAVMKQIREGGHSCPAIVKLEDTGQYTFHRCAAKVILDFNKAYVSSNGYRYGFDGFGRTSEYVDNCSVMVSPSHPVYAGVYLFQWIRSGGICDECGAAFLDYDEQGTCPTCAQKYQLLDYNARAEDILETEDTKDTLFGIELEYEGVTAKQVAKCIAGHAISKRDGTVRSGVEVVTRPASVLTHKKSLLPFYEQVKVAAKSNTGMHVHVDKSKLSNYEIGFMMEFLNKTELISHIEKIAGREYSKNPYCAVKTHMKMSWGNRFDEGQYKIFKAATEKYSPLNTAKDKTIEVRIFSSPESYEEMCAKLDFVAALVKYSSPYAVSVKKLADKFEWSVFTDFVQANRKTYPHFCSYFLKEQHVTKTSKTMEALV